jgi:hypothetical protein
MPVFKYFAASTRGGSMHFLGQPTYNGSAVPTVSTYNASGTGQIPYLDPNAPGGGTYTQGTPGRISAQGVAVAGGRISVDGTLANSFGVISVTKNTTGQYDVYTSVGSLTGRILLAVPHGLGNIRLVTSSTGQPSGSANFRIEVRDTSNVLTDPNSIMFAIF